MMNFVAVKALAGFNYIRPDQVVGIAASDPTKCTIYLTGGVMIPSSEPAKDVIAKLEAATGDRAREPQAETK
ncbi:MAG: hypothetical protein ABR878_07500 [Roseiarcus sp.]|jgi:hypothetical protein